MLKLYGTSKSRASRSILALEELGLDYEHVPWGRALRDPASVERQRLNVLNPNGHIPVLDHDGFIVWESMAINLYLGATFGGPLWPGDAQSRGLIYQWSFWAQTEMDRRDWDVARRTEDESVVERVTQAKVAALTVLDGALAAAPYLLGQTFTLADLNVASTLSEPHEEGRIDWQRLDPRDFGLAHLGDWLERCTRRESWHRVADYD
ncbi:MAG: glutathione S-transferase family protein [Pseudomonadales bacterium]